VPKPFSPRQLLAKIRHFPAITLKVDLGLTNGTTLNPKV
jgi:hypothetical protein